MARELTEEDIYADDTDPLEAIRLLREEEGAEASEDLKEALDAQPSEEVPETEEIEELQEFHEDGTSKLLEPEGTPEIADLPEGDEEEEEETPKEPMTAAEKRKFKANGQEFEFTQAEMLEQFESVFGKAMDYTQKMQKISPYRKMISALESEDITQDQLNLAIDALKGDKNALQQILKTNEIDTFDLPDEDEMQSYVPRDYGKNDTQLAIEDITSRIEGDQEYAITVDVVDRQWDASSRQKFASNPEMILGLHNDIKSGVFDQVMPQAMKMKVLDGNTKSDLEYYILAGEQLQPQISTQSKQTVDQLNKPTQDAAAKFEKASSEATQKRAAASTGTRADRKGVIDYLDDDNDEKFDAWYKKLHAEN